MRHCARRCETGGFCSCCFPQCEHNTANEMSLTSLNYSNPNFWDVLNITAVNSLMDRVTVSGNTVTV